MSANSSLFQRGILRPPVQEVASTTYTLGLEDEQSVIVFTAADPVTVTLPNSVSFPIGYIVHLHQQGDGQVEVTPEAGVDIGAHLSTRTRVKYSALSLFNLGSSGWVALGDQGV